MSAASSGWSRRKSCRRRQGRRLLVTGTGTTVYDDLKSCDLVIEAATENLDLKLKIIRQIDGLAKPTALVASNTSSISITTLAAVTSRPAQFLGMHFFNPVPMMTLVELIRGLQTSDATIAAGVDFAEAPRQGAGRGEEQPGASS